MESGFRLEKGFLLKKTRAVNSPYKLVIPDSLQRSMLEYFHNDSLTEGHSGIYRTLHKIMKRYTWTNLVEPVKEFVKSCDICQKSKDRNTKVMGTLGSRVVERINENWMVDVVGPLPSNDQTPFILICVDNASRFTMLERFRTLNTKTISSKLYGLFCRFGFPESISSDNSSVFTSDAFKSFMFSLGIKHIRLAPYHAEANVAKDL